MHPQNLLAAATPPVPPSTPPTTLEAHILRCLSIRERAMHIVRLADREVLLGIAQLDADDGDPDLELQGDEEPNTWDDEPSLGAHEGLGRTIWECGGSDDREPSLGFLECQIGSAAFSMGNRRDAQGDQTRICLGYGDDREDEHDGREAEEDKGIDDDPHDGDADVEPSLGGLNNIDQTGWADGSSQDGEAEFVHEDDEGIATEIAAVVRADDGSETIVRHVGDPLKGLRVIADAVEARHTVREVLFKCLRGRSLGRRDNLVPVGEWVRH